MAQTNPGASRGSSGPVYRGAVGSAASKAVSGYSQVKRVADESAGRCLSGHGPGTGACRPLGWPEWGSGAV